MLRNNHLMPLLILGFLLSLGLGGYYLVTRTPPTSPVVHPPSSPGNPDQPATRGSVSWSSDNGTWTAMDPVPDCPDPLVFPAPVDVSLTSGILYPGQIRGTDYKPHGGFRFDNRATNDIQVRAIMDGYILKAARYEDSGEVQNFFFYVTDCGIMVMHDHLLTLSPQLQPVFAKLPLGKNGDSRTTEVTPRVYLSKGDLLATEIGYKKVKNIFLDFGLYDLRHTNGISYSSDFRANNPSVSEYGAFGLCWFNYLEPSAANLVRSLPAGGHEGKTSDYCK